MFARWLLLQGLYHLNFWDVLGGEASISAGKGFARYGGEPEDGSTAAWEARESAAGNQLLVGHLSASASSEG